jgi:hypothetical protein
MAYSLRKLAKESLFGGANGFDATTFGGIFSAATSINEPVGTAPWKVRKAPLMRARKDAGRTVPQRGLRACQDRS